MPPPSGVRIKPCDLFQFRITFWNFESFLQLVGFLWRGISPTQGLYLHRTAQCRKTKTNIHAWRGIRTNCLSEQAFKAYASERAATGTGYTAYLWLLKSLYKSIEINRFTGPATFLDCGVNLCGLNMFPGSNLVPDSEDITTVSRIRVFQWTLQYRPYSLSRPNFGPNCKLCNKP
jgi:hypothetical protein